MPTAEDLCETYASFAPHKICNLRVDSLALMINMANINPMSRVLILENTKGLVTGAVIERCVAYALKVDLGTPSVKVQMEILGNYNFGHESLKRLGFLHGDVMGAAELANPTDSKDIINKQLALQQKRRFSSCIICHDLYHPKELYDLIAFALQPSASIAIFSTYVQPLAELQEQLMKSKKAVHVRIEELWTREYQVYSMRTHPAMSMHGASGYLLSALKVA